MLEKTMEQRQFPNWEQLYQEQSVETMPWFYRELDADIASALSELNLSSGRVLDLGTGPGTQAIALAQRGFRVTATDLSATAIEQARQQAATLEEKIDWRQDDILYSQLEPAFEVIIDRGCFHVLDPERRPDYVRQVARLLTDGGYLLLKTFSVLESREEGPYRFTPEEIEALFESHFSLNSARESVYYGTLSPLPRALFCILVRKWVKPIC